MTDDDLPLIESCDEHPNDNTHVDETDGPFDVVRCATCGKITDAI